MQTFRTIAIEKIQDFWNRRPCNIRHSAKPIGSREYFDEVEARKYFVEPHIPAFAQFERWRGQKVLEIGCGIGTDTINFARHGASVTAVELSEQSLALARKRAAVFGLEEKIRFFPGNAEDLNSFLPVEQYDLVYSFGVIHHTPNPERVFEQIKRYLGPKSTVKVMVYNRRSWKVFWILLKHAKGRFWKLEEKIAQNSEAETGCPVTYTYNASEIRRLMRMNGLDVQEVVADHIFPWRIPDYVQYRYVKVWCFRYIPSPLFRWMERRWGWHLLATALVSQ